MKDEIIERYCKMIKLFTDSRSKIIEVKYENNDFNITIETRVLTVRNPNDENNIGTILENYRSQELDRDIYFTSKREILEKYIGKFTKPFDHFSPEEIICIYPIDKNRRDLIEKFKDKLIPSTRKGTFIDYSENFYKKDKSLSIKKDKLKSFDYELTINSSNPFKNLLIIDDVINEGETLEILLDKLLSKGLINSNTTIKLGCMYNLPTMDKSYKTALKEEIERRK